MKKWFSILSVAVIITFALCGINSAFEVALKSLIPICICGFIDDHKANNNTVI